jgi:hypothetical protein
MKKLHLSLESSTNFFRKPNRAPSNQAAAFENARKAINPIKTHKIREKHQIIDNYGNYPSLPRTIKLHRKRPREGKTASGMGKKIEDFTHQNGGAPTVA